MALVRIQLRRDTAANWTAANPVLANGEPGLETDTGRVKYGNGVQNWAALPYASNVQLASSTPPAVGTAATGTSAAAARADHTHALPSVLSLQSLQTVGDVVVGGNATVTGTLTANKLAAPAASITDLPEAVQDIVGEAVKAGDGISVTYNDALGTITIAASGAGSGPSNSLTGEDVDDRVSKLLVAGTGIKLEYNDSVNTLTVSAVSLDGGDVEPDVPPPPPLTISSNPQNVEAEEEGLATFSVSAAGGRGQLRYQWEFLPAGQTAWQDVTNGSGVTGATTSRLSVDGVTAAMNRRWYRCAVTDDDRTARSRAGQLRVSFFEITVQPVSTTAVGGSTTPASTFSVTAVSDDPITYQWQSLASGVWGNISGATSATFGSISATANATYRCSVTSNGVTVFTNAVTLTVTDPPVTITAHPQNATASSGSATFTATFTGGTSPTSRWQVQRPGFTAWEDISGATTTTLSLAGLVGLDNGNKYRIVITSGATSLASNAATLTVSGPAITIQPQDATAAFGAATFTFAYSGGTGSVQWWRRPVGSTTWTAVSGQTANTLSLTGLVSTNSGHEYSATVTISGITVRTRAALLTVSADVFFTAQPQSVTVDSGQEFTMTFTTTYGANEVHYFQWQQLLPQAGAIWRSVQTLDAPAGSNSPVYTIYPGQRHPTLRLRATVQLSGAQYRAHLYKVNTSGIPIEPLYSETATLTVTQPPSVSVPSVLPVDRPASMISGGLYANHPLIAGAMPRHNRMATFAYGSGRIVGVGHGGAISNPPSATPSTSTGLPLRTNIQFMDRLNRGTNFFIYSDDDGATWASGQFPVSAIWTDVAYGGGRFVAVGLQPGGVSYSLPSPPQGGVGGSAPGSRTILCMSADGGRTWQHRVLDDGPQRIPRVIGSANDGFLISANKDVYHSDGWNAVRTSTDDGRPVDDGVRVGGAWATIGSRGVLNDGDSARLLGGNCKASTDNGVNWRLANEELDYADPTFGESQSVIASTGDFAVVISSSGTHIYSTTDGFTWVYRQLFLPTVNSGGTVNTVAVRAIASAGQDVIYLARNAYQVSTGAQPVAYQLAFRAPSSSPHLASPLRTDEIAVTPGMSAEGHNHVLATDRYFLAIDTVAGSVLRFPLAVSDPNSDPEPTDGRPLAPRALQATPASPTSIALSWQAAPSGGAPITNYTVQRSTDMGRTWSQVSTPASSSVSVTVTGLTSGTSYMFRVAAVNSIGTGPYSYASNMTAAGTIRPSAPRSVLAVPATHTASNARMPTFLVTWQVPEADGGSPVTGYEIQTRKQSIAQDGTRGAFSEWAAMPPRGTSGVVRWSEVTGTRAITSDAQERPGVRLGVQHRVAARNVNGLGPWSEGNVVDWGTTGGSTGGTPPGPGTTTAPGPATSLSTTLVANPIGDSSNPGFSLSWTAPAAGTGGTPSGYSVQVRKQTIVNNVRGAFDAWEPLAARNTDSPSSPAYRRWATVSGTTATVAMSGMRPGTTYGFQFRVAATNEAGSGAFVEGSVVDWPTASSAPSAPQSVAATRINNPITGNTSQPGFSVTWTAPSSAGSSSISSYVVQWRHRPVDAFGNAGEYGPWQALSARDTTNTSSPAYRTWATVSGTSATVSGGGFRSTLKYDFQIRVGALNSTGASPWGESSAVAWPAP